MKLCFLCEKGVGLLSFNESNFEKVKHVHTYRRAKCFKYCEIVLPESMDTRGYHIECFKKFCALKKQYREEMEIMFSTNNVSIIKCCLKSMFLSIMKESLRSSRREFDRFSTLFFVMP